MAKNYFDIMKEEKPFNMAERFLHRLDNRLDECNVASIEGDLFKWYRGLKTVFRMISFKIDENKDTKVYEEIKQLFDDAKIKLQAAYSNYQDKNLAGQIQYYSISKGEQILDKIESKLVILMYNYKLIFPDLYEQKTDKNIQKFIQMYVKKSVIKKAIEDKTI